MIHFEKRLNPSRITTVVTPIIAVILTMIAGGIMFAALGKPPLEAIRIIFGTLCSIQISHPTRAHSCL